MKKLAAQALAFQYQLQIENAQAVLNNNNAALNLVDQALHEVINANEKLKVLNTMMRLYTDENPRDTVSIKFATPADARATVAKVKRINKPYARKIQILTVMEQRAKVMGKTQVVAIAKRAKEQLKKARKSG